MPTVKAIVAVEDMLDALDMVDVPEGCRRKASDEVRIDVEVSQSEIDDHATWDEPEPEFVYIDPHDLRDGIRALFARDLTMASILLQRAFDADVDARRVVEEECLAAGRKAAA